MSDATNLYTLQVPENVAVQEIISSLASNPSVAYVESAEITVMPYITANDPQIDRQRHLR